MKSLMDSSTRRLCQTPTIPYFLPHFLLFLSLHFRLLLLLLLILLLLLLLLFPLSRTGLHGPIMPFSNASRGVIGDPTKCASGSEWNCKNQCALFSLCAEKNGTDQKLTFVVAPTIRQMRLGISGIFEFVYPFHRK